MFVAPALKLGEEQCQLQCSREQIKVCIKRTPGMVFINTIKPVFCDYEGVLNLSSLAKIGKLINFIDGDDIEFDIFNNYITCHTGDILYKMFLLSDDSMDSKKIDENKFDMMKMPIEFDITYEEYRKMDSLTSLIDNEFKLYFSEKDEKLVVSLTNNNKSYSSDVTFTLKSPVKLEKKEIILKGDFLDILTVSKGEDIFCRTDGERVFIAQCGNKKYIMALLLK